MSPVFCFPREATPLEESLDVPSRLATAVAMGPAAVKVCAGTLTSFSDAVGQSALLKKSVQEHVPELDARVWCDTLLKGNLYTLLLVTAFGADPSSVIAGFLLPTRDWRIVLNDAASRHPVTGTMKKRDMELAVSDAALDIAPLVTPNFFSSMCASCTAVTHSVPANARIGRGIKMVTRNRIAAKHMRDEESTVRAQTAPARLQKTENHERKAAIHEMRKNSTAAARNGKLRKKEEE